MRDTWASGRPSHPLDAPPVALKTPHTAQKTCACLLQAPPPRALTLRLRPVSQASAAAFAKALLDLEGTSLTPILVSLVKKDASMLDAFGKGASDDINDAKNVVYEVRRGCRCAR